jgi:hypothetical protein
MRTPVVFGNIWIEHTAWRQRGSCRSRPAYLAFSPSFPKPGEYRRWVHTHSLTEPRQRPALPVEPDSLVDLDRRETPPPHRNIVPMQDRTHCSPVKHEPFVELVDGGTCHVPRDELLDLLAVELPRLSPAPGLAGLHGAASKSPATSVLAIPAR